MWRTWGKKSQSGFRSERPGYLGTLIRGCVSIPIVLVLAGCSFGIPEAWKPVDIAVPDGLMDAEQQKAAIDEMVRRRDSHTIRTVATIEGARPN